MKTFIIAPLLLISAISFAQSKAPVTKLYNPPLVAAPKGYSHVAEIDLGNAKMLIISGQVPLDAEGKLVGKSDFKQQADQVFINLKNIIESAGGSMANLVKLGYFVLDVSQLQDLRDVRDKYINIANPPASTLVAVKALYRNDILLEVEATAVIPKK